MGASLRLTTHAIRKLLQNMGHVQRCVRGTPKAGVEHHRLGGLGDDCIELDTVRIGFLFLSFHAYLASLHVYFELLAKHG